MILTNFILNGDVKGYLSANIDTTQTTLALYSLNTVWTTLIPLTNYYVVVRVDGELMCVTAVTGTSPNYTLTIIRSTDDPYAAGEYTLTSGASGTSHNQGALLFHTVTAYTLNNLFVTAINGTPVASGSQVNYISHGFNISVVDDPINGITTLNFQMPLNYDYGILMTPPLSGWTQLAQADSASLATVNYDYTGISLTQAAATAATHRLQALYRAYDAREQFKILFTASPSSTATYGMLLRESSTGKMYCIGHQYGSSVIQVWTYSDSNTQTSAVGSLVDAKIHHNKCFFGLAGTGNPITYSFDNYAYWPIAAWSGYFTDGGPDQMGFWIDTPPAQNCSARLVSMCQSQPNLFGA